jgi:hypothetical protein
LPRSGAMRSTAVCLLKAPQRVARFAAQVPARLVDVERARRAGLLEQLVVDGLERLGGAGEDRVDRADGDRATEQLVQQLDQLSTREPVARTLVIARLRCDAPIVPVQVAL